jgi:signal transduction histidine kinase/DNA-binding response OmpR family regulator
MMNSISSNRSVVVLVDDDLGHREAIAGLLSDNAIDCRAFEDGDEAYNWLIANPETPNACLIDLLLPQSKLSGTELLRKIRVDFPSVPVLVYSGKDNLVGPEVMEVGANLFVRKPFEPATLLHMVMTLIRMNELSREIAVTGNDRDTLQRCLDAMNVQVTLLDTKGKIITANASAKLHAREVQRGDRRLIVQSSPVRDANGNIKYFVQTATDVTRHILAVELARELAQSGEGSTPEELCDLVAEKLHQMLGYSRVRVYIMKENTLYGVASRGMQSGFNILEYTLGEDDPNAVRAFKEQKPNLLNQNELVQDRYYHAFDKCGVRHQLNIPGLSSEQMCMIIVDDKGSDVDLTTEDMDVVGVIGSALGDAIQFARNRIERERRLEWYQCFERIDKSIAVETSIRGMLQVIVEELQVLLNASGVIVMIRENESLELKVVACSSRVGNNLSRVTHDDMHGFVSRCIETSKQLVIDDSRSDKHFMDFLRRVKKDTSWSAFLEETRGLVLEPVLIGQKIVGAILVQYKAPTRVPKIDLCYVNDMARRVAIALAQLEENRRITAAAMQEAKLADLALLTAGFAHGIRNPLSGVSYAIDSLKLAFEQSEHWNQPALRSISDRIQDIKKDIQRGFAMVDRLVKWSRPQDTEEGLLTLDYFVLELIEIVRLDFEEQRINLQFIPAKDRSVIYASPITLRTALPDILWNAKKAMPHGGRIEISLSHFKDAIRLRIEDTGHGMPQEDIDRLFKFDPLKPLPAGGNGLGLYLARKSIQSVGGTIRCKSAVGKGTQVDLWFLINRQAALPEEANL